MNRLCLRSFFRGSRIWALKHLVPLCGNMHWVRIGLSSGDLFQKERIEKLDHWMKFRGIVLGLIYVVSITRIDRPGQCLRTSANCDSLSIETR
jgi:hypothetical protein